MKRDDELVEMEEEPHTEETKLQELLAEHPNLLVGDQINRDAPRRWLLLTREAGLATSEDGVATFSIDHLLLDQDAIPTLVETKRASNREIRS